MKLFKPSHAVLLKQSCERAFNFFILILLIGILSDEACDNFIIDSTSGLFPMFGKWLVYLLLVLQIIFSPIQSGISDVYCRKKSLIVSISATTLSVILLSMSLKLGFFLLVLAIIIKGVFGNTLPISLAGLADVSRHNNFRFTLALAICFLAVGSWGLLYLMPIVSYTTILIVVLSLSVFSLFLIVFCFADVKDQHAIGVSEKTFAILKKEFIDLGVLVTRPTTILILLTFFFSEFALFQILLRIEVYKDGLFMFIPLGLGIGYTLGTISLKFVRMEDKPTLYLGLVLCVVFILVLYVASLLFPPSKMLVSVFCGLYTFGMAFFTPSLFSFFTNRSAVHEVGKVYGIFESTDSLATVATLLVVFNTRGISSSGVFLISTAATIISGLFMIYLFKYTKKLA